MRSFFILRPHLRLVFLSGGVGIIIPLAENIRKYYSSHRPWSFLGSVVLYGNLTIPNYERIFHCFSPDSNAFTLSLRSFIWNRRSDILKVLSNIRFFLKRACQRGYFSDGFYCFIILGSKTSGQVVPKLRGACQHRNTPQEWGRKPFRGERQSDNESGGRI